MPARRPGRPPVELQPCGRFEWERIIRRIVMPQKRKLVACILAQYGDIKGGGIRPGEPRLASVTGMGMSTVRRYVAELRSDGLIEQLSHGGGRGVNARSAEYRLTVPVDALDRFTLLDPDERPADPAPGAETGPTPLTVASAVETPEPVDNPVDEPVDNRGTALGQVSAVGPVTDPLLRSLSDPTALTFGPYCAHLSEHPPCTNQTTTHYSPTPVPHQGTILPSANHDPIDERTRQTRALHDWTRHHPETITPEAS
jgi:hypothetical protein